MYPIFSIHSLYPHPLLVIRNLVNKLPIVGLDPVRDALGEHTVDIHGRAYRVTHLGTAVKTIDSRVDLSGLKDTPGYATAMKQGRLALQLARDLKDELPRKARMNLELAALRIPETTPCSHLSGQIAVLTHFMHIPPEYGPKDRAHALSLCGHVRAELNKISEDLDGQLYEDLWDSLNDVEVVMEFMK